MKTLTTFCLIAAGTFGAVAGMEGRSALAGSGSLSAADDSTSAVYYTVANNRDTTFYVNPKRDGWKAFNTYLAAENMLKDFAPATSVKDKLQPMSPLFDVASIGTINSVTKSANGLSLDGTTLVAQTADGDFPGLLSTGTQTIAGAKTFSTSITTPSLSAGNSTVSGKVNVNSPANTIGDLNTGAGGVYSWNSASRYIRFNTAGNFNDFLSTGAKLVVNHGFAQVPNDVSFFEHTMNNGYQAGHLSIGTNDISARLVVRGYGQTSATNSFRTVNSTGEPTFTIRNDGRIVIPYAPEVSTGNFEVLTRNTSTGLIETVALNTVQDTSSNPIINAILNQNSAPQTGNFDISGSGAIGTKLRVGSAAGTTGAINAGADGIYSWRDANRFIRFNANGTANDFQSTGAKLAINFGFSGPPEDITMFEHTQTSGSQAGHLSIGTGDVTGRVVVRGVTSDNTNYAFRTKNAANSYTFSVRNDGLGEFTGPGVSISTGGNSGMLAHSNTGSRSWHLPDTSGTLALASSLSGAAGYMPKFTASNSIGNSTVYENAGNVGIGTTSPAEKLSVNGKVRAKEVKVEVNGWPDYVFEADYKNPSLQEVEYFIENNKHLPGIPSQKEVGENGISLGEMNAKLLQKIEELTLHLIAQDKEQKAQAQILKELQISNKLLLERLASVRPVK